MPARAPAEPQTFADIAERLMAAYEWRLPLATVSAIVCKCRSQLAQVAQQQALPSLVYKIANNELRAIASAAAGPAT